MCFFYDLIFNSRKDYLLHIGFYFLFLNCEHVHSNIKFNLYLPFFLLLFQGGGFPFPAMHDPSAPPIAPASQTHKFTIEFSPDWPEFSLDEGKSCFRIICMFI